MKYGIYFPNFRTYADPRRSADLAREAELAGWDGVFVWDHVWASIGLGPGQPVADPWVMLAAIACTTERVRIGPLVTPVARRRPWKLAREIVTLDHLSNGRVIFGAGLGTPVEEYEAFGENSDAKVRARKLDEGLAIVAGLLSGEPFDFEGDLYSVSQVNFAPRPVQKRIPVWIGGNWPAKPPFRRAARWQGVMPLTSEGFPNPGDLEQAAQFVTSEREADEPFDIVACGFTETASDTGPVASMHNSGATWWLESFHDDLRTWEATLERARQGPPRI
jgi:alkanesulfonate monooxygenase SsuD/methylene tetrahydromethanopterin reductase-like flavin-dependent oxidoreductase (luciferase family)